MEIDELDRRILRELRKDGRLTNTKLAEKVGLSTTPCWNRVRALEDGGMIEGYTALISQTALGYPTPSSSRSRWTATTTTSSKIRRRAGQAAGSDGSLPADRRL
jgi:DNA-binding Lrp family transcriptional regulator